MYPEEEKCTSKVCIPCYGDETLPRVSQKPENEARLQGLLLSDVVELARSRSALVVGIVEENVEEMPMNTFIHPIAEHHAVNA